MFSIFTFIFLSFPVVFGFNKEDAIKLDELASYSGHFDMYTDETDSGSSGGSPTSDTVTLSAIVLDVGTSEQYIEDLGIDESVNSYTSSNIPESAIKRGVVEPYNVDSDNNNNRRLVILGDDERDEVTSNPPRYPNDGNAVWSVCIGFNECPDWAGDCCCTGTMIDHKWVLTAAHCIHEGGTGSTGWFSGVTVWPRRTRNYTPQSISSVRLVVWDEWYSNDNRFYDQGWIELESNANVGFAGWGWNSNIAVGWEFGHFGYSCDKPDGSLWQTIGDLSNVEQFLLFTDTTDTWFCNSGGPWYYTQDGYVYANHRGGLTNVYNVHVRITQSRFAVICSFMDHKCGLETPTAEPTEEPTEERRY